MLQINTGKLFANGVGRTNDLRGVLYSNLKLAFCDDIITAAGTLRTTQGRNSNAIVYELEEKIEESIVGPGVLLSHCVDPFLQDFAAVASFGLNILMSPNSNLVTRLTSGELGLSSYDTPDKFLRRCFDKQIYIKDDEVNSFTNFVDQLLGLERKRFLSVMRAIRTYVSGVQRIPDDLSLAYTLMVTAVESLAQDFDGYESTWDDVHERKRKPLDKILENIGECYAKEFREAILSVEHISIGRRYCAFVLEHIDGSFFRSEEALQPNTVSKFELDEALKQAYTIRSKYVHNLRVLPDELSLPFNHREVAYVDRRPTLTLQGISRLSRHVIKKFVEKSSKVEREIYNYTREEAGVVVVPLAPQYWIASTLRDAKDVPRRLEGFLQQLVSVMSDNKNHELTDIRPVLLDIERIIDQSPKQYKPSMLLLHGLFNYIITPEQKTKGCVEFCEKYEGILIGDTPEQLIGLTIIGKTNIWSIDDHRALHDKYFNQRSKKSGFHAPQYFEAAASLELAERYRLNGDVTNAQELIATAVENFPSCKSLHQLETDFNDGYVIKWHTVLFPKNVDKPTDQVQ